MKRAFGSRWTMKRAFGSATIRYIFKKIFNPKFFGLGVFAAGIALAAPFAYNIITAEGTPSNFATRIDNAFKAWGSTTATTLKLERQEKAALQFKWGSNAADATEFNPDEITRSTETEQTTLVEVNPAADNIDSGLLVEAGQRLGLELEASISGKREITEADRNLLRAKYSPNGDFNNDGKINIDDLEILAANFGKSAQPNQALTGDLNGDGKVDEKDLEMLQKNYVLADLSAPVVTPVSTTPPTKPSEPTKPTDPNAPANSTPADPSNPAKPPAK